MGTCDPVTVFQIYGGTPGKVVSNNNPALLDTGPAPPMDPSMSPAVFPVGIGKNSYETFLRLAFVDPTAAISAIKVYYSGAGLPTGVALKYKASWSASAYSTPTSATSSVATTSIPTTSPASANVSVGNSLTYSQTSTFLTDYIVFQAQTTSVAVAASITIPITIAYTVGATPATMTFNLSMSTSTNTTTAAFIDISGIFMDFVDITGILPDEEI